MERTLYDDTVNVPHDGIARKRQILCANDTRALMSQQVIIEIIRFGNNDVDIQLRRTRPTATGISGRKRTPRTAM